VQSVNGDITLMEPEGGGAEFVVRFPLSQHVGEHQT
jgi:hypothetical protein